MDTITQGLLGAATAQLGFRQRIGKDAGWVATGAAIVPDLDMFIQPILARSGVEIEAFSRLEVHRGLSHSLLMTPLLAVVITFCWWRLRRSLKRPQGFGLLFGCVFTSLLSHPLLDWCTTYGTQLFTPLTTRRYAVDAIAIVDIFYTGLLIITLLVIFITRIRKKSSVKITLYMGWIGFGLSVGYIATGYGMGRLAVHNMREAFSSHDVSEGPVEYKAYPQIGSIFLWRVTRFDGKGWAAGRANLLFLGDPEMLTIEQAKVVDNQWINRARQLPEVQTYEWFAMGQLRANYAEKEGEHIVDFHDMRYGGQPESLESMWPVRVTMSQTGEVIKVERLQYFRREDSGSVAGQLWKQMWQK